MTTIKKILVPTDFSETARNAYEYAIDLAEQYKATIDVVHVFTATGDGIPLVYPDKPSAPSRKDLLQEFVTQDIEIEDGEGNIDLRRVHVNAELIRGSVAETLIELSKKDYDLMVIGSTGGGVFAETIFGSMTTKVAQDAYCPVLVVPKDSLYHQVKRLLYACDFNHKSFKHPALIADVAAFFKAKVDVIYVEQEEGREIYDAANMADMITVFNKQAPQLRVKGHVIEEQDVFYGINDFTQNHQTDMIVMVTKHYTILQKLFHPSITKEMAMYTNLPLLVLKSPD